METKIALFNHKKSDNLMFLKIYYHQKTSIHQELI